MGRQLYGLTLANPAFAPLAIQTGADIVRSTQDQKPSSLIFSSLLLRLLPANKLFQKASSYRRDLTGTGIGTPQPRRQPSSCGWSLASIPRKASRPERPESTAWMSSSSPSQPEIRVPNCDSTSS